MSLNFLWTALFHLSFPTRQAAEVHRSQIEKLPDRLFDIAGDCKSFFGGSFCDYYVLPISGCSAQSGADYFLPWQDNWQRALRCEAALVRLGCEVLLDRTYQLIGFDQWKVKVGSCRHICKDRPR